MRDSALILGWLLVTGIAIWGAAILGSPGTAIAGDSDVRAEKLKAEKPRTIGVASESEELDGSSESGKPDESSKSDGPKKPDQTVLPRSAGGRQGTPTRALPSTVERQGTPTRAVDPRPLLIVYTDAGCIACERFKKWEEENRKTAPFQFEFRKLPDWCREIPAFHFKDSAGKWRVIYGWTDIGTLQAAWVRHNPNWKIVGVTGSPGTAGVGVANSPAYAPDISGVSAVPDITELLKLAKQFGGNQGKFTFTPDTPINTHAKEDLTVRYKSIAGRYDLTGARPKITFDEPLIGGTATIMGVWNVGYKVESVEVGEGEILVNTDWKRVRISLENPESPEASDRPEIREGK